MATRIEQGGWHGLAPIACAIAVSVALFGCTNTGRNQTAPPPAVATSDPFVLSGVAYTQGDAQTQRSTAPAPPPSSDIVTAPAGTALSPVVSATPLPPTGTPPPAVVGAAPLAPGGLTPPPPTAPSGAPPAAVVGAAPLAPAGLTPPAAIPPAGSPEAAEYPNINIPPKQPGGQLLTPEEREKLIQELNALAGKPGQ